jgi:hypothetical protein
MVDRHSRSASAGAGSFLAQSGHPTVEFFENFLVRLWSHNLVALSLVASFSKTAEGFSGPISQQKRTNAAFATTKTMRLSISFSEIYLS